MSSDPKKYKYYGVGVSKFWLPASLEDLIGWEERGRDPLPVRKDTTPLLGHRAWLLYKDAAGEIMLHSLTRPVWWEGPVLRGDKPRREPYKKPYDSTWGAGIYAFQHPQQDLDEAYGYQRPAALVRGEIELFGTVVRHTEGMRGENARVKSLILPPGIFVTMDDFLKPGVRRGNNIASYFPRHRMDNGAMALYVDPRPFRSLLERVFPRSDQREAARALERRYGVDVTLEK